LIARIYRELKKKKKLPKIQSPNKEVGNWGQTELFQKKMYKYLENT
jgi:hypothetical protein